MSEALSGKAKIFTNYFFTVLKQVSIKKKQHCTFIFNNNYLFNSRRFVYIYL